VGFEKKSCRSIRGPYLSHIVTITITILIITITTVLLLLRFVVWLLAYSLGPRTWLKRFKKLVAKLSQGKGKQGQGKATSSSTDEADKENKEGDGDDDGEELTEEEALALVERKARAAQVTQHFKEVVLPGALIERVQQLAVATRNAKRNCVPYRHLLLYGPPGTGKTVRVRDRTKGND
jgi:hypothetical protein